jgi:hypothetical protein
MSPYTYDGKVLLDVQQLIPLPEAEQYMVRVKGKEIAQKRSSSGMNRDKFIISVDGTDEEPRGKGRAVRRLVELLTEHGVPPEEIQSLNIKFKQAPPATDDDAAWTAFTANPKIDPVRWFKEPIVIGSEHWFLTNQWGTQSVEVMAQLCALKPDILAVVNADGKGQAHAPGAPFESVSPTTEAMVDGE